MIEKVPSARDSVRSNIGVRLRIPCENLEQALSEWAGHILHIHIHTHTHTHTYIYIYPSEVLS